MPEPTPATTQALATREPQARGAISFAPRNYPEAVNFSKIIANTDMVPKDFKGKPEQIFVAIQMGAELGLAPMAALQNIAVINGRPSLWGDAVLAVIQNHPSYEWHKEYFEGADDKLTAVCEMKRKGQDVHVVKFSVADAQAAGLLGKDIWKAYRRRMLQMRARAWCARDKFADALRGLGVAEEVMDMPAREPIAEPGTTTIDNREAEIRAKLEAAGQTPAQINATLAKYAGKLDELLTKIEEKEKSACPAPESATPSSAAAAPSAAANSAAPPPPSSATTPPAPAAPVTPRSAEPARTAPAPTPISAPTTPAPRPAPARGGFDF